MFAGCLTLFYNLFYELERSGRLNPNDDIHLWCLHCTFLPVINKHLTNWKNAWIHHPLRSEGNSTPMQLWIRGLNSIWGSESTVDREVFQVTGFVIFYGPFTIIVFTHPLPPYLRTIEISLPGCLFLCFFWCCFSRKIFIYLGLKLIKNWLFCLQNDFAGYGSDWDGPVPAPSHETVEVPETRCPIDSNRMQSLSPFYPPHDATINDVTELFLSSVQHVYELLNIQQST